MDKYKVQRNQRDPFSKELHYVRSKILAIEK